MKFILLDNGVFQPDLVLTFDKTKGIDLFHYDGCGTMFYTTEVKEYPKSQDFNNFEDYIKKKIYY